MQIAIDGFWTTKAGDYDPQKSLSTPVSDNRFFYRINHDATSRQKVIVEIMVDTTLVGEVHEWLSSDGKETLFFDVPSQLRKPGSHTLFFRIFSPVSEAADAKKGTQIYESEHFVLDYTG
ncbi:hypothetical protein [uncultured Methanospirillum sp.]|uniref:hypothetical protein n=1 Tax=uncultured Methanospirillum sp. TaxID=262503 RepID=UPI0029C68FCE|nr:hypothetical protein [uncultured Methanospirillum sp.]